MDKILLVLILFDIMYLTLSQSENDYIWREFNGVIPADAFIAGSDKNCRAIYIGQVSVGDQTIPGRVQPNDNKVYIEWHGRERSESRNAKILCSSQVHKLEWITTTETEMQYLNQKMLVKGGQEVITTYVGRIYENGVSQLGKIICQQSTSCIAYTSNNRTASVGLTFDILTFNPTLNYRQSSELDTCKNLRSQVTINFFSEC